MPNYFAHLTFGAKVYDRLSPALKPLLRREWEAYCCGQYGPDPLFFYYPGLHTSTEEEGHALHRQSPAVVLERFRGPVLSGMPYAFGYAAGYLCHYLLDSGCHPYVYANAGPETNSHMAMEAEFDRYLMNNAGFDPHKDTPLLRPQDKLVLEAAALGYVHTNAAQYRRALNWFYDTSRLLTHLVGVPVGAVADLFQPKDSVGRGIVLKKVPNAAARVSNRELERLLLAQVPLAAEQIPQLWDCCHSGKALDFPWRRSFLGEEL